MLYFIEKFRESNKDKSLESLVSTYYDLLTKIEECRKEKDHKNMLMYCQLSLQFIESLIEHTKREFGSFDITSIPAIETGAVLWAIQGNAGQLHNIKEIVEYFPELQPWEGNIHQAFTMKKLASDIYRYVKENKGCLQKDLRKVLGACPSNISFHVI